MTLLLGTTGLHLDKAWTEWGPVAGEALRQWSMQVLAELAETARRLDVDLVLIAGDLFARATTVPATVDYAVAVLESMARPVVVVPGPGDWFGEGSPYTYRPWPAAVRIVGTAAFSLVAEGLWASGWTAPSARTLTLPADLAAGSSGWMVRPAVSEPAILSVALPPGMRLVTSGLAAQADEVVVLASAIGLDLTQAEACLLRSTAEVRTVEAVPLGASPVRTTTLDVTGLANDAEMRDALLALAVGDDPVVVRLAGVLGARVLPPVHGPSALPDRVIVVESGLEFDEPEPESGDRTAEAEFLRGISRLPGSPRQRHLARALGLQGLSATGI